MITRAWLLATAIGAMAASAGGVAAGQNAVSGAAVAGGAPWQVPRTSDGRPQLEGIWTNATITPFERGANFSYSGVRVPETAAGRAVFTEEEAARFAALTAADREASLGYVNRSLDAGTDLLSTRQTSLVVNPPDGRVPVKPWAEADRDDNRAHESDDYRHTSVWDRCLTRGVPGSMFPAGYNNAYRFVQTPGAVVIQYEMIHDVRIIPVDGRRHQANAGTADTRSALHCSCVMKNITLTLPEDVALWLRIQAAKHDRSVSRWLGELLEGMRRQEDEYDVAMERFLARARQARTLKRPGDRYPTRDELHDRTGLR